MPLRSPDPRRIDSRWIRRLAVLFLSACLLPTVGSVIRAEDTDEEEESGIDVSTMQLYEGFFNFFWDAEAGSIWLQLSSPESGLRSESFLYATSLATGLGSNPVGLDRGQLGSERIVYFRKVGNQVYLIQENWKFIARTENQLERQAIKDSFAESVIWSGEIEASSVGSLVDVTSLLLEDAHNCASTLEETGQGKFSLDEGRSFIHLPRCKAFPLNTEFEATLTFASSDPGRLASRVAADGQAITLRQHHSFVQLPDGDYQPRKWDPRVGCFSVSFADYAVPIDAPIQQRFIARHRLQKIHPEKSKSPVKEPIIYYLDPGVPEPVRSALLDGARWWAEAFEAAGFEDAFRVEILPAEADPMDVRYNVIQWVHRATRGWSYGQSFTDPRTGEIIKGHVLLGSLRVRQDHLLFQGLGNVGTNAAAIGVTRGSNCSAAAAPLNIAITQLDASLSSTEVALSRIRQLSAHEVGHTLGFAHNFAASTYADRASVMDYPAPRALIAEDGTLDLSDAYGVGIGAWDKFAVQYAYGEFPEDEEEKLEELLSDAISKSYRYITDADARPSGAAHPYGNLWDNGADPIAQLQHDLKVRQIAIDQFSEKALHASEPLSELERTFVPVYLHHRYQVDAVAKFLGGYDYSYSIAGDGQVPIEEIPDALQRRALDTLLQTISPTTLVIPDRILKMLPPRSQSGYADMERFDSQTAPIFDPAHAMRTAAELTLGNLLQSQRVSRIARDADDPSRLTFAGICTSVWDTVKPRGPGEQPLTAAEKGARRIVERVFANRLMDLAGSNQASDDARQAARLQLSVLSDRIRMSMGLAEIGSLDVAQWTTIRGEIERFLNREFETEDRRAPSELPPGSPIGN